MSNVSDLSVLHEFLNPDNKQYDGVVWSSTGLRLALTTESSVDLYDASKSITFWKTFHFNDLVSQIYVGNSLLGGIDLNDQNRVSHRLLRVFNIESGQEVFTFNDVSQFEISDDETKLAIKSISGSIKIINLRYQSNLLELNGIYPSFAINHEWSQIAVISQEAITNNVELWSFGTGTKSTWFVILPGIDPPQALAFAPYGDILAVKYFGNYIKLWNVQNLTSSRVLMFNSQYTTNSWLLAFSANHRCLVFTDDNGLQLWDAMTSVLNFSMNIDPQRSSVVFSKHNDLLIVWTYGLVDGQDKNHIEFIDVTTWIAVRSLKNFRDPTFNPLGNILATWNDKGVSLWIVK